MARLHNDKQLSSIAGSPTRWIVDGTGRATCRICGAKIEKGAKTLKYFVSHGDGGSYNPNKGVEASAHLLCAPENLRSSC